MIEQLKIGWHTIMSGDGGGYGHISNQYYDGFVKLNATMVDHTSFDWDVLVAITPPRAAIIGKSDTRHDICFHSMFECSSLPPGWTEILNKAGLIWVPSEFCRELFIESGVTRPIFKVGYAVDTNVYRPAKRTVRDEPFKILVFGDSLESRKNVQMAIKAFMAADLPKNDSVLEVKVSDGIHPSGGFMYNGVRWNNIHIYAEHWHRWELVRWLHGGDMGIYLSGGEGYGLQPQEMMATGLPMVCAANTGMLEYLDPSYSMMVECPKLISSPTFNAHFGIDLKIWQPDFDQVVEYIRWGYSNRQELYDLGNRAVDPVTARSWDTQSAEAYWHIYQHYKG